MMPPALSSRAKALPTLWLITDARNDARLEETLKRLPRGSGLIFRHYHLEPSLRRLRFNTLARLARRYGHTLVLSGSVRQSRRWRADGAYGSAASLAQGPTSLRLITVHSLHELAQSRRARADAVLLSPMFATASHPNGGHLGAVRWRLLAARALTPVIALGGMTAKRARAYRVSRWAAIDGLSA